jgi:hypothetical protein
MLFKNYNQISYNIGGKTVTLLDIFRSVSFDNVEQSLAFDTYYIQDGETPEIVSSKFYGTSSYSWLIMMINAFSSIKADWFVSSEEYNRQKESRIGGDAIYISSLPDIQQGDIFVKVGTTGPSFASSVDITAYRQIADFDPYFRKIRGICGGGTFESGDTILFARKNTNNGLVDPLIFKSGSLVPYDTDYTKILYKEPYEKSISYLYTSSDVTIDPYLYDKTGRTSINSDTIYLNTSDTTTKNNFARSVIYKYSISGGTLEVGVFKKTLAEIDYDTYLNKQQIKILKPEFLSSVVSMVETALGTDQVGKRFRIEL